MSDPLPKIIAVVGITASGKTDLAIELAKEFNGELVSCDSRQMYKEMEIGTNKDRSFPHHLMDIVYPNERFTVADFQKVAYETIDEILSRGKLPILVGGTAMYVTAILENWQIPDGKGEPRYDALLVAPTVPRPVVYERINNRVGAMIKEGLVEEVKQIAEKYGYKTVAMTGHAYQQIAKYLLGEWSLEKAIEESKKVTRNYAKRQWTWWGKPATADKPENQPGPHGLVHWVKNKDEAFSLVRDFLNIS